MHVFHAKSFNWHCFFLQEKNGCSENLGCVFILLVQLNCYTVTG